MCCLQILLTDYGLPVYFKSAVAEWPWKSGCDGTQHLAMGEGDVDFDGIFETLRDMDFANKQLRADAPKAGGDNIACVSMFGFPEKMDRQAPRLERGLNGNY